MISHTVAKGDTIDAIARKYKIRDGKTLWAAPENKELASRRKKADNIQPGDKLFIPPSEKDRKETAAKLDALKKARDANLKLREALRKDTARRAQAFNAMTGLIIASTKSKNDMVSKLENDIRAMQNVGLAVDTAAALIREMHGSVTKLAKLAKQAASATGAELAKIGRDAASEIADVARDKAGDVQTDLAIKTLKADDTQDIVAKVLKINDAWDLIQQPSFWGHAATQVMEGKTITQAVKGEIGDDLRERSRAIENLHSTHDHQLREATRQIKTRMLESAKLLKGCEARLQSFEVEIKAVK